jgi:hypothetical protein
MFVKTAMKGVASTSSSSAPKMITTHFVHLRWPGVSKKSSSLRASIEALRRGAALVPAG